MIDPAIGLTPVLVLLILALFRFTGCKSFGASDPPATTPTPGTPPAAPLTYENIVAATPGFTAHWRLNETGGNLANVLGPLKPGADGTYKTGPAGAGMVLGTPGVLSHKDPKDLAPEFAGTAAFVEIPYNAVLNPAPNVSFSIELWVKPDPAAGTGTQVLVSSHKIDDTNKRGYEIALVRKNNEPHQQVRARFFSTAGTAPSEVVVQPNQGNANDWRHIVLTYQSGAAGNKATLSVRIIGSINPFKSGLGSPVYENVLPANTCTLRFGAAHRTGTRADDFFAGRLDEVAFYNAALADADIEAHFKQF